MMMNYYLAIFLLVLQVNCGVAFSKDGEATKFVEAVPVVGYVASAAHAINGNTEHAKRAAAKCTNSILCSTGTVVGGMIAGPPGAVAGGALLGGLGHAAEAGIARSIKNKTIVMDCAKHDIKDYIISVVFTAASGGLGKAGANGGRHFMRCIGNRGIRAEVGALAAGFVASGISKVPMIILGLPARKAAKTRNKDEYAGAHDKLVKSKACKEPETFLIYYGSTTQLGLRTWPGKYITPDISLARKVD